VPKSITEIKRKYFDKIYDAAAIVFCACGCGRQIKSVDRYARPKKFVSGHNGRKYEDPTQYKREWNHRNRPSRQVAKNARFRMLKIRLVNLFGGECADCGFKYDGTNARVFHFHHREPKFKSFTLGNQLCNKAWDLILAEANKCDLLCANCHELKHGGDF
jgi:hypothetical protein